MRLLCPPRIPHFARSTADRHKGNLILRKPGDVRGACHAGPLSLLRRLYHATGYLPIRVMENCWVEILLVSNAAGGINTTFKIGKSDDHYRSYQYVAQSADRTKQRGLRHPFPGYDTYVRPRADYPYGRDSPRKEHSPKRGVYVGPGPS